MPPNDKIFRLWFITALKSLKVVKTSFIFCKKKNIPYPEDHINFLKLETIS